MLKSKTQKKCIAAVAIALIAIFIYNCVCKQELSKVVLQKTRDNKTNIEYNEENQDGSTTMASIGDINLDGSIDIADVIALNKNLLGIKQLSDEQKAVADCNSDGIINSSDSLTLLKYVLEIIWKLPADKDYIRRAELFANKNGNDFYRDFISNKNTTFKFNEMAILVHKVLRQSALDNPETLNYTNEDVEINDIYSNGSFGNKINSYGYVGLCLFEYAVQKEDDAMLEYVMESQGKIYGVTDEKAKELGWQKINYTSAEQLQVGDIIVSPESAQIYLGDGVYSCENGDMIKEINLLPAMEPTESNYIIRIEPKSGKDENMEWSIEDGTLSFFIKGECGDDDLPWKASLYEITDYKVYTVTTYYASAAGKLGQSLQYSQRGGIRYVTFVCDGMVEIIKMNKKAMEENPGYDMELVSNSLEGNILSTDDVEIKNYAGVGIDDPIIQTYKLTWNGNLDDEFYKTYVERNVTAVANHMKFYKISEIVKKKIAESRTSTGNRPDYNESKGIVIPGMVYSDGKIGENIDCSSFVCMCLYEYGIHTGDENIIDFIKFFRKEAGGSDLGVGGQITARQFYEELDDETLDKIGMKILPYEDDSDLRSGDILVKGSHIEIYAENGLVFNCGANMYLGKVRTEKTIQSRAVSPGDQAKILRFK